MFAVIASVKRLSNQLHVVNNIIFKPRKVFILTQSTVSSLSDLLAGRSTSSIELKHENQGFNPNISSIEQKSVKTVSNQGEIPDQIDALIDNKMYRNRYKRLIREGNLEALLFLSHYATMSGKVAAPNKWFAKSCSLKRWEGTLRWITRMMKVARQAMIVANRLGSEVTKYIYKQIHRGINVEHLAALAKESGKDPYKFFCWLIVHNPQGIKS